LTADPPLAILPRRPSRTAQGRSRAGGSLEADRSIGASDGCASIRTAPASPFRHCACGGAGTGPPEQPRADRGERCGVGPTRRRRHGSASSHHPVGDHGGYMRMLVLGGGLQGSACAYDLLKNEKVERVVLADLNIDRIPPFLRQLANDPRLELVRVDARDEEAVSRVMQGVDACMNALPYYFNLDMTRLAVRNGVHYSDLGGNTEIVFRQQELDAEARERGVSVIPDCGLAPGMVNILAAAGIAELDEPESVRIFVGGLPQEPEPPLNYQIVYSIEGVLDYYTTRSWVLRDGEPRQVDALTEIEPVEFPEPVGTLEAFHTAGGLSTLPWTYRGRLKTMEYKTLRYPGHAEAMRVIRDLGLLGLDPVQVNGQEVVPRKVFIACVEPRLRKED